MTRRAAKAFQGHLKYPQTRTAASDLTKAPPRAKRTKDLASSGSRPSSRMRRDPAVDCKGTKRSR